VRLRARDRLPGAPSPIPGTTNALVRNAGVGGALVRVRGWIDLQDGPRLTITHPDQIEVLAVP